MDRAVTTRAVAAAYVLGALVVLALLFAWERGSYVNYAEGVYLFSARLITDGHVPYRDFIAAHPPLLFYSGAAVLALSDTVDAIRVALSLVALATGALVAITVLRLTGSGVAAVVAGIVSLLAPWSLHEHATLTPETFGAPLLMGAALLASRPRTSVAAGLVAAVAIGFKWPFILPGLLVGIVAPRRWRSLLALLAGFAAGVLLSFALFGADRLYQQLVVAQQDVGWHSLREAGGLLVQAAWNLLPLLVPAVAGVVLGRRARDPMLWRTLLAVGAGNLILVLTVAKTGTYLNTVAVAEPPLVALGACGVVWLWRLAPARPRPRAARAALAAVAAATLLGVAQVAAFLAAPASERPGIFVRPFSAPAAGWPADVDAVDRAVRIARACPPGRPYSGHPYVAFVARRRAPGDEPDQFLRGMTPVGVAAAREAAADAPPCP
jgi:hypothetical protein